MSVGSGIFSSAAVVLVVSAVVIYVVLIFNGLISLKNNIRKSWANIDVLLKQRNDEVPRLVECVKGYTRHEQGIMNAVAQARVAMMRAQTISQKAAADNAIEGALKSIFSLAENYPDLKASALFRDLQYRITALENQIADRREFYNDSVNAYNTRIQTIPDVFVAKLLGYTQPEEFFKVADGEKQPVNMTF